MKIHRFMCQLDLMAENIVIRDPEITHQIRHVLKLAVSEKIVLCDGQLNEAVVRLAKIDKQSVEVAVLERRQNQAESQASIFLCCAILKRENFELVVQKATELGVACVVPLVTARTVKLNLKLDRLVKIAKEAAEQSGRGLIPQILEPLDFESAVKQAQSNDMNIFFDAQATDHVLTIARQKSEGRSKIGLFIGPEGGWDESEIAAAQAAGMRLASLGKTVLRAETAAMAAVFAAANALA